MFTGKTFSGVDHLKAFCFLVFLFKGGQRFLDSEVWEFERGLEVGCEVDRVGVPADSSPVR